MLMASPENNLFNNSLSTFSSSVLSDFFKKSLISDETTNPALLLDRNFENPELVDCAMISFVNEIFSNGSVIIFDIAGDLPENKVRVRWKKQSSNHIKVS